MHELHSCENVVWIVAWQIDFLFSFFFAALLKSPNVHSFVILNNHHPFEHPQVQQHINHGRLRKEAHSRG